MNSPRSPPPTCYRSSLVSIHCDGSSSALLLSLAHLLLMQRGGCRDSRLPMRGLEAKGQACDRLCRRCAKVRWQFDAPARWREWQSKSLTLARDVVKARYIVQASNLNY
eukprot:2244636-Pleurochrysis_carterae.AAC.4